MATKEKHISVEISAPYYTLNEPGKHTKKVWFVCHGYGQLSRYFLRKFEVLDDSNFLIFPQGLHKFYLEGHKRVGASWMTKEDRLTDIENQHQYLKTVWDDATREIDLTNIEINFMGFSQGVATIARHVTHFKPNISKLIIWAGTFPPELSETDYSFLNNTAVRAFMGDQDEFFNQEYIDSQFHNLQSLFGDRLKTKLFQGKHEVISELLLDL
jgi:predicted esterase